MAEVLTVTLVLVALAAVALGITCVWEVVEIELEMRRRQEVHQDFHQPSKPEGFSYVGQTEDGFAIYE